MPRLACNREYFSVIDSEPKAYWLGVIAADGHVRDTGIFLKLQERDRYLVEQFRLALESHLNYGGISSGVTSMVMAQSLLVKNGAEI